VRPQRARNQPEPANEQDQHHQRVEKAGRPKIDAHVGDHARQNEKRTRAVTTQPARPFQNKIPTVQALLGHSSPEVTRQIHLHAIPAEQRRAVEDVEKLLVGPKLRKSGSGQISK